MNTQSTYLSITELNNRLNTILITELPEVSFEGEISQCTRAASGHIYFTVKDDRSQMSAVMWRGMAQGLGFTPETGQQVQCQGKPNVYHASGRLQVVVHAMRQSGEGELQRKYLELKAKLAKEGLFSSERKRTLPFLPKAVGVVTSGSGAVIHDIMVKIQERMPVLQVYLVDVRVQGEGAASEIAEGIELLDASGKVDVIIVGRGGGSLEDLWAFNEEEVVRAVFASRVPVVSGVGHEVDVSLSDLVADVRAPTPTAAAELITPRRVDLLAALDEYARRLDDLDRWFFPVMQRLDDLSARLDLGTASIFDRFRLRLDGTQSKLDVIRPKAIIDFYNERIANQGRRLKTSIEVALKQANFKLAGYQGRFEAISPQRVLQRGFAIVQAGGNAVRSETELKSQDKVTLVFSEGGAEANIETVFKRAKGKLFNR